MADSYETSGRRNNPNPKEEERPKEKYWKRLLVPLLTSLIALVAATIMSSFIVPKITYSSKLKEERLKKALDILSHSTEVDRRLNVLLTTLEIFHKDNSGVAARLVDYREEQKELRVVMQQRYVEFDEVAWWWYGTLSTESVLLQLAGAAKARKIEDIVAGYEANLIESTAVLNDLWNRFLREEYDPTDNNNTAAMNEAREEIEELGRTRRKIVSRLAEMVASD